MATVRDSAFDDAPLDTHLHRAAVPTFPASGGAVGGEGFTVTDQSGTITTGGTAQDIAAADRSHLVLENLGTEVEALWYRVGGTAAIGTEGSQMLLTGQKVELYTSQAVSVIAATTGHKFSAVSYA